jgi:nucleoside-diphosphate-sugar epimerase
MLAGHKILLTGPAGNIGYPLTMALATNNDVWAVSRFGSAAGRAKVDEVGVTTRAIDLGSGEFDDLPTDFEYVLHLAAYTSGNDYSAAVRTNAEGTALLMTHCRKAKAFLSMSTTGVYTPHEDPWHAFREGDPVGGNVLPTSPHYPISKVVQEGVARAVARQLGLPTIIARMNAAYGNTGMGGLPGRLFDQIQAGNPVTLRWDPTPYSVIHDRDIYDQVEALLDAASPSAPITNWGGDEAVPAQDMCALFGEILGVTPDINVHYAEHSQRGVVCDNTRRMAITGPCRVHWRDGMREMAEAHLRREAAGTD